MRKPPLPHRLPTLLPPPTFQLKQQKKCPIKMGLIYCTAIHPAPHTPLPPPPRVLNSAFVTSANTPGAGLRAVSQVPGRGGGWRWRWGPGGGGGAVCVLGKQPFVGCDCLILLPSPLAPLPHTAPPPPPPFHSALTPSPSSSLPSVPRCGLALPPPCSSRTRRFLSDRRHRNSGHNVHFLLPTSAAIRHRGKSANSFSPRWRRAVLLYSHTLSLPIKTKSIIFRFLSRSALHISVGSESYPSL